MSSAADRQAAYKARQRQGEAILAVRCNYHAVIEALLDSNRISESDALDRHKVEEAVADLVRDWALRWRDDFG
jgi:hypothetical protein